MSLSFQLDEEQQAIVDAVHEFAAERIRPRLRDFEEAGRLPEELERECHDLGLTTLPLPERLGGSDALDLRVACLCAEELAWGDVGAAVAIPGPRNAAALVLALGDEATQARLLGPFGGEDGWQRRGALALVEGPFGLAPDAIETTARREGDAWVLSGRKRYVQGADRADLTLVLARVEGATAPDPWDRLGVFAVVGRPQGLAAGERQRMLGLNTASFSDLELSGVRIPAGDRLGGGAPGELRRAVERAVARKKVVDAARLVGCVRAASEYAFKYATERQAFGVYLYEHQGLAFMMAEMATLVDALRARVWELAWRLDKGEDAYGSAQAVFRQVAERAVEVASDSVQVLGGHGYLQDHPVEKWMRDVRTLGLVDGLGDEAAELAAATA